MFKLPDPPSPQADCHEVADFAELLAWKDGQVSESDLHAALGRDSDNSNNTGCDDDDDDIGNSLDDVMTELQRRQDACRSGYPFVLDRNGNVLRFVEHTDGYQAVIYCYLLLCTRLNMQENKRHDGIDGTALFEELSAHVLQCYLGRDRSKSFVFGTAVTGGFEAKVNDLCRTLGEGVAFRNRDERVDANDDKLDAVAWVPFTDGKRSQLVIFGQCKTGTSWDAQKTQLQPDAFIDTWIQEPFLLPPVRAFCITESSGREKWHYHTRYAGLFFDRCRLVDFCGEMQTDLLERIMRWTSVAIASVNT